MKAICYLRVSKDSQADSGLSIEAQEQRCREFAEQFHPTETLVISDLGVSGAKPAHKRPGLTEVLRTARKGDAVIVLCRDRLGRDSTEMAIVERDLERSGIKVFAVNGSDNSDTAEAKMMKKIVDAFSEYERHRISDRIKSAFDEKRRRGERLTGSTPYGYDVDGKMLIPNEHEQGVISIILDRREAKKSLAAIANELNEMGEKTKRGAKWNATQVGRVIKRENEREAIGQPH